MHAQVWGYTCAYITYVQVAMSICVGKHMGTHTGAQVHLFTHV